ncbi:DUF2288 domain-containing protein [Malonomonas rubra]|uniref:DUF2288 domain-containing protein n=1 Tax=Malonomonas rubra TaxID=57040 RepID=UPI0026ED8F98|nr:DUF2288 domain-containing protein [Malonomonas rubra]
MSEVFQRFKQDLAEVCWKDLRIHLQRDAIIIVAEELDLVEVAAVVAEDNKHKVANWIGEGQLVKPTAKQLSDWELDLNKPFRMLIVQPFILVQMVNHA